MKAIPRAWDLALPLAALGLAVYWLATRAQLSHGIGWAIAAYGVSHVLRIARLVMFFVFEKPSLVKLSAVHAWSAWLSALIPFKLGEIARAWAVTRLARKPAAGLSAYATEKVLDATVLLAAIFALTSGGYRDAAAGLLAAILVIVILFGLAAYLTSRATSTELRQLILTSSNSARGLRALSLLNVLEAAFRAFRQMLGGRVLLLFLLTIGIWTFDFTAFCLLAMGANPAPGQLAVFIDTFESVLLQSVFSPWHVGYWNLVALTLSVTTIPASLYCLYRHLADRPTPQSTHRVVHSQKYYSGESP